MNELQFGEFTVDPSLRQLRRREEVLVLPGKAFDLLLYMAANAGRPLSKVEILEAVWPGSFVEESNLTQNVFLLRKALGTDGPIRTLPGRGYQFAARVVTPAAERVALSAETAAPVASIAGEITSVEAMRSRLIFEEETEERIDIRHSPIAIVFVVLMLVLLGAVGWLGWQRYEDRVGGPPVQVVLADFDGTTGDPVLDRTLKDILRFGLGQSPFVTVVPASTVRSILPQMRLKPDDPLTLEVARDLCERTASQAVLHGHLVRTGNRYLITEEATNCVDGATLGTAKQQVQSGDDLPGALDRIGAALRHDLGESRRTIARFNQPLLHQVTGSLEALEDFSQANYVGLSGRYAEAVELLKKAVALDPQFAAAYINLYVYSQDALDTANANLYLQKAYDLREFTTQPTRFAIVAYYDGAISGDLNESLRNDQLWINLYPRSTVAWNALANVLVDLGRYPEAVEAARRHLEMQPNFPGSYLTLASDQMQAGDFAGSRKTCDLALSRGFDQDQVHTVLLDLGHLTHDADLIAAQERWGDAHPDSTNLLAEEVAFAIQEGRFTRARQLADRLDAAYRSLGADVSAVTRRQNAARAYFELGEPAFAHQQLHLAAVSSDAENQVVALAEDGQIDAASAMLAKQLADCPKSTSWTERYGPELNAEFALLRHDPARAVLAMASAGEVDINVFFVHGEAYREAGQFGLAETEFRSVLARAPTNPTSWQVPQAQLMLARTLASEGKKREAIEAYNAFFAMWSHADPNASLLLRARSEYASIQAQSN